MYSLFLVTSSPRSVYLLRLRDAEDRDEKLSAEGGQILVDDVFVLAKAVQAIGVMGP